MARYAALLDSCVLVPIALADTLLRVAERGLYRPLWSDRILEETGGAISRVHPEIDRGASQHRFEAMNESFPDVRVVGWDALAPVITLPDRGIDTWLLPHAGDVPMRS